MPFLFEDEWDERCLQYCQPADSPNRQVQTHFVAWAQGTNLHSFVPYSTTAVNNLRKNSDWLQCWIPRGNDILYWRKAGEFRWFLAQRHSGTLHSPTNTTLKWQRSSGPDQDYAVQIDLQRWKLQNRSYAENSFWLFEQTNDFAIPKHSSVLVSRDNRTAEEFWQLLWNICYEGDQVDLSSLPEGNMSWLSLTKQQPDIFDLHEGYF